MIANTGRDGDNPDEALDAMEADHEALPARPVVAAHEDAGDTDPRQDRRAMAVDAAALVLGGMELGELLLHATPLPSFRSIPGAAASIIAIFVVWLVARKRDRFGYWMLLALAGLMLATSVPGLLGAAGLEAMLLASRAMAGALAVGLLLGPARRHGTEDDSLRARRG